MKSKPRPTSFHYNGLCISLHPEVYEPAEDTFQLLKTIAISTRDTILEIGTGCGLIALECARQGCRVLCTDINPYAVALTHHNIKQNRHLLKGTINVRKGDMFSPLKKNECFNIIIFNPPYLPTQPNDIVGGTGWFDVATNGGKTGLVVIKKFLDHLRKHIEKKGLAYFVFSSLSSRTQLIQYLDSNHLQAEVASFLHCNDETIEIYRVSSLDR